MEYHSVSGSLALLQFKVSQFEGSALLETREFVDLGSLELCHFNLAASLG